MTSPFSDPSRQTDSGRSDHWRPDHWLDDMPRTHAVLRAASRGASPCAALQHAAPLGVWPLVVAFAQASGWHLPPATADAWRAHIASISTLRAIRRSLAPSLKGLRWLVLKGDLMSSALFGSPWARSSSDIDLLVHPDDIAPCFKHLRALGYLPTHSFSPLGNNQLAFAHPHLGVNVEVHWRIEVPAWPQPSTPSILSRALTPEGESPSPDPVSLGLITGFHFAHHQGALKPLTEWAAWWDRFGDQFGQQLWDTSQSLGLCNLFAWGAATIERLGGPPCGPFSTPPTSSLTSTRTLSTISAHLIDGCLKNPQRIPWLRMVKPETHRWQTALLISTQLALSLTLTPPLTRFTACTKLLALGPHRLGRHLEHTLTRLHLSPPWISSARLALHPPTA